MLSLYIYVDVVLVDCREHIEIENYVFSNLFGVYIS